MNGASVSTDSYLPTEPAVGTHPVVRERLAVALVLGAVLLLRLPYGIVWASLTWAVGAGLIWSSPRWSARSRAMGTLLWPGGLIGPVLLLTNVSQVCTTASVGGTGVPFRAAGEPVCTGFALEPWVGIPAALIAIGVPFWVAAHLLRRLDEDQ